MRSSRSRRRRALAALGIGTLLAAGVAIAGWSLVRARSHPAPLQLARVPPHVFAELRRMAREDRPPPPGWLRASEESELRRFRIPEALARELYATQHPGVVFDPLAGTARAPDFERFQRFPKHPRGGYTIRTNSSGLRRDREVSAARPDLRVLVIGDSHVDAPCNNAETFPAQLEQELARRHPERTIELLNAATGGHHPYQYLGVIESRLSLQPDVCVLVWFAGNDFHGVIAFGHLFEGTPEKLLDRDEQAARDAGMQLDLAAMAQGFTSVHYFARRPDELPFCERISREVVLEARLLCEAAGARLIVCVLPSPCELEWEEEPASFGELRRLLRIDATDVARHARLSDGLLAALDELGIEAVDLRPALAGPAENFFWRTDLHLSVRGQRKLAGALLERFPDVPARER